MMKRMIRTMQVPHRKSQEKRRKKTAIQAKEMAINKLKRRKMNPKADFT